MGGGGLQNRNIPVCHLPKISPLSFKAAVSARENLYLYVSKLRCLNELKAGQDASFLSSRLRTKSSSLLFGSPHGHHPLAPNLFRCPLFHRSRAETREGLAARHCRPRVLAGSMALAGQRQLAWPAGNTTLFPEAGQQPDERGQARGKCAFREAWRLPLLGGSDDSGKRDGGRNSETLTHRHPLSLTSQDVSPPSPASETKPCFLEGLASALESQGGCLARSKRVSFRGLARPPPPVYLSPISLHSKCGLFPDFHFRF